MISTALIFIRKKLDQHLINRFQLDESITVLNHLVSEDGSSEKKNRNKMVITLINLDYETHKQYQDTKHRLGDNGVIKTNPASQFNLDVLFTACFEDYEESLKFLSTTIAFFQSHNSLNAKTTPDIPPGIKALNFEIENTSFFETHNLWSAMGAKYQPSVIYKVRHVTIQSDEIQRVSSLITGTDASVD